MEEFRSFDALALAAQVRRGEVTAHQLLTRALAEVDRLNPALNAVVSLHEDAARRRIDAGLPEGPFTGVPFLLKDLGAEAVEMPARDGSQLMADSADTINSTLFDRLTAAGLVPLGRTATPENGIGVATEAALYGGPTRNPWDLDHTPGGSSGGAAAAVSAGIVPAAHGSDGGGSVRIPASCCGLFGFKPTRARLPDGPVAGESWGGMAIDGFLTRSVRDTAALLDICMGADVGAPYVAPALGSSFMEACNTEPGRLRIAVCDTRFDGEPVDPDCARAVQQTAALLKDMGHRVRPGRPDTADHGAMMAAWTDIIACGTALSVRRRLQALGRPLRDSDLEPVSHGAVRHAATLSGTDYLDALDRVHAYGRAMAAWFRDWDMLLTPTLAEPPARIGRFAHTTDDFLAYRLGPDGAFAYSPFAAAFNATGQPAMSVPLGMSRQGLPIGVHFAARYGEDECLMSLAADLERAQPWFHRVPTQIVA